MASFEELNKTVTEIRNDVVCQVCEDPARPGNRHWYRCMKLHQICQDCKEKKKKCSCGDPILTEYCRQTEKLFSVMGLKFKCVNTKNGCQETFFENALKEHEFECIFRQVPCPYNSLSSGYCTDKIYFHDVIQHYESQHNEDEKLCDFSDKFGISSFGQLGTLGMSGEDYYIDPDKITLNNQTFLFCQKTRNNIIYKWVYILGSPIEAKHFSYTLKLIGRETKSFFEGKMATIDEPFDTLFKAGKCFAIPHEAFIAQFVTELRSIIYIQDS